MSPRSKPACLIVYALLFAGAAVFLFPFLWLVCTSLKPIEQTMSMPPTWLPRAYHATLTANAWKSLAITLFPIGRATGTSPSDVGGPQTGSARTRERDRVCRRN